MKFGVSGLAEKSVETIGILLKSDNNNGVLYTKTKIHF
jgi:hypothetical protein